MANVSPLLVALPLDHETPDIVATAVELGRRLEAPIVAVHAVSKPRLEAEARSALEPHLAPLREAGIQIEDVVVAVGDAAEQTIMTASRIAAQMIISGGGRPATVRRWMVGSVAEAIVRGASVPVWIVRGKPPAGRPLLCPVDLSEASKLGLQAAIRMARVFQLPLSLIAIVNEEATPRELAHDETAARGQLEALLKQYDIEGLDVSLSVTAGEPAERIVEAADEASLLVIASRGYDPLVREWLGPVTSRALRHSTCSTLTIRHLDQGHDERVRGITRLADLYQSARDFIAEGAPEKALPILEVLAEQAPTNPAIQEAFAIALEGTGRSVEATGRHELAALIRTRIGG